MPFLLDSTLAELVEQGYEPRLVAHPILAVRRDGEGRLRELVGPARGPVPQDATRESLIHIHLDAIDEAARERLRAGWSASIPTSPSPSPTGAMRERLEAAIARYRGAPPPLPAEEMRGGAGLSSTGSWPTISTLLGVREYSFPDGDVAAAPIEGSGLGMLRDPAVKVLRRGAELVAMTPEVRAFLHKPSALIITKANVKSRVHRRAHLDYIGVKLFSDGGEVMGELRVVGLFHGERLHGIDRRRAGLAPQGGEDPRAGAVRSAEPRWARADQRAGELPPATSSSRSTRRRSTASRLEIMNLADRPRVRVAWRGPTSFDRFVSVLVFIPKDRYDTQVRRRVGEFLAGVYQGRVSAAYPAYPEGPLARHALHHRPRGGRDASRLARAARGGRRRHRAYLGRRPAGRVCARRIGGPRAAPSRRAITDAFNAAYREAFSAHEAIRDILVVERMSGERPRAVDLYRREGDRETRVNLKVFSRGAGLPAVGARAAPGEPGLPRGQRADLPRRGPPARPRRSASGCTT